MNIHRQIPLEICVVGSWVCGILGWVSADLGMYALAWGYAAVIAGLMFVAVMTA